MSLVPSERTRPAVLVVEGDAGVRRAIGLILEDRYDPLLASDGPTALKLVHDRSPDVAVLDLDLPSADGIEILAAIKTAAHALPVIALSADERTDAIVRAVKRGACDYLTKPFQESELLGKVAAALTDAVAERGKSSPAAHQPSPSPRGRCLVMVAHAGTAGTLRLVLQRHLETEIVSSGLREPRAVSPAIPQCVICDEPTWYADGAAFIRAFRRQHPGSHVMLISGSKRRRDGADRATLVDELVPEEAGLAEVVRRTLALCSLAGGSPEAAPGLYVFAAMDYLRQHYAERVTSPEIARAAGISRGYLAERFRAEVGLPMSRYLMSLRVEVAKALLGAEKGTLADVAARTGFRDPSHLSRVFQAHTGRRPGAYRRETAAAR